MLSYWGPSNTMRSTALPAIKFKPTTTTSGVASPSLLASPEECAGTLISRFATRSLSECAMPCFRKCSETAIKFRSTPSNSCISSLMMSALLLEDSPSTSSPSSADSFSQSAAPPTSSTTHFRSSHSALPAWARSASRPFSLPNTWQTRK